MKGTAKLLIVYNILWGNIQMKILRHSIYLKSTAMAWSSNPNKAYRFENQQKERSMSPYTTIIRDLPKKKKKKSMLLFPMTLSHAELEVQIPSGRWQR